MIKIILFLLCACFVNTATLAGISGYPDTGKIATVGYVHNTLEKSHGIKIVPVANNGSIATRKYVLHLVDLANKQNGNISHYVSDNLADGRIVNTHAVDYAFEKLVGAPVITVNIYIDSTKSETQTIEVADKKLPQNLSEFIPISLSTPSNYKLAAITSNGKKYYDENAQLQDGVKWKSGLTLAAVYMHKGRIACITPAWFGEDATWNNSKKTCTSAGITYTQKDNKNDCGSKKYIEKGSVGWCYEEPKYTCPAGQYLPAGSTACKACEKGNYCTGVKDVVKSDKPQGIAQCPDKYKESVMGATQESDCYHTCETIEHAIDQTDKVYLGNECTVKTCAEDYKLAEDKKSCILKTYTCPAGKYLPANSTACKECEKGHYCTGVKDVAESDKPQGIAQCPDNTIYNGTGAENAAECTPCEDKQVHNADHTECKQKECDPGLYLPDGTNTCTECQAGHACTGDGSATLCNANQYATAGSASCTSCPNTHPNSNAGATADIMCWRACEITDLPADKQHGVATVAGQVFYNGNTSGCGVSVCKVGYTRNGQQCDPISVYCPATTYLPKGGTSLKECPAGYYCEGGQTFQFSETEDQGLKSCESEKDTAFKNFTLTSNKSAKSINECYFTLEKGYRLVKNGEYYEQSQCDSGVRTEDVTINYNQANESKYKTCEPCTGNTYENADRTACIDCPEIPAANVQPSETACGSATYQNVQLNNGRGSITEVQCKYDDLDDNSTFHCSVRINANNVTCATGLKFNGTERDIDEKSLSDIQEMTDICIADIISCAAGQYLPAGKITCATCPAGSYCEGGNFTLNAVANQGIENCAQELAKTPYRNLGMTSDGGESATSINSCYFTLPAGHTVNTSDDGDETYEIAQCDSGVFANTAVVYYGHIDGFLDNANCTQCGDNKEPNSSYTACVQACPELDDGMDMVSYDSTMQITNDGTCTYSGAIETSKATLNNITCTLDGETEYLCEVGSIDDLVCKNGLTSKLTESDFSSKYSYVTLSSLADRMNEDCVEACEENEFRNQDTNACEECPTAPAIDGVTTDMVFDGVVDGECAYSGTMETNNAVLRNARCVYTYNVMDGYEYACSAFNATDLTCKSGYGYNPEGDMAELAYEEWLEAFAELYGDGNALRMQEDCSLECEESKYSDGTGHLCKSCPSGQTPNEGHTGCIGCEPYPDNYEQYSKYINKQGCDYVFYKDIPLSNGSGTVDEVACGYEYADEDDVLDFNCYAYVSGGEGVTCKEGYTPSDEDIALEKETLSVILDDTTLCIPVTIECDAGYYNDNGTCAECQNIPSVSGNITAVTHTNACQENDDNNCEDENDTSVNSCGYTVSVRSDNMTWTNIKCSYNGGSYSCMGDSDYLSCSDGTTPEISEEDSISLDNAALEKFISTADTLCTPAIIKCEAGYYNDGGTCAECPDEYPNSEEGAQDIAECYYQCEDIWDDHSNSYAYTLQFRYGSEIDCMLYCNNGYEYDKEQLMCVPETSSVGCGDYATGLSDISGHGDKLLDKMLVIHYTDKSAADMLGQEIQVPFVTAEKSTEISTEISSADYFIKDSDGNIMTLPCKLAENTTGGVHNDYMCNDICVSNDTVESICKATGAVGYDSTTRECKECTGLGRRAHYGLPLNVPICACNTNLFWMTGETNEKYDQNKCVCPEGMQPMTSFDMDLVPEGGWGYVNDGIYKTPLTPKWDGYDKCVPAGIFIILGEYDDWDDSAKNVHYACDTAHGFELATKTIAHVSFGPTNESYSERIRNLTHWVDLDKTGGAETPACICRDSLTQVWSAKLNKYICVNETEYNKCPDTYNFATDACIGDVNQAGQKCVSSGGEYDSGTGKCSCTLTGTIYSEDTQGCVCNTENNFAGNVNSQTGCSCKDSFYVLNDEGNACILTAEKNCKESGGEYVADDTCTCPEDKVYLERNQKCVSFEEMCLQYDGTWGDDTCNCPEGEVWNTYYLMCQTASDVCENLAGTWENNQCTCAEQYQAMTQEDFGSIVDGHWGFVDKINVVDEPEWDGMFKCTPPGTFINGVIDEEYFNAPVNHYTCDGEHGFAPKGIYQTDGYTSSMEYQKRHNRNSGLSSANEYTAFVSALMNEYNGINWSAKYSYYAPFCRCPVGMKPIYDAKIERYVCVTDESEYNECRNKDSEYKDCACGGNPAYYDESMQSYVCLGDGIASYIPESSTKTPDQYEQCLDKMYSTQRPNAYADCVCGNTAEGQGNYLTWDSEDDMYVCTKSLHGYGYNICRKEGGEYNECKDICISNTAISDFITCVASKGFDTCYEEYVHTSADYCA